MKKLGLLLLVSVTMFACAAPETKSADAPTSSDPKSGTFTSLDDKSQKVKELLEA